SAWQRLIAEKPWKAERLAQPGQGGRSRWGRAGRVRRGGSEGQQSLPRDTVVGCRVDADDLGAIDLLVEAGIRTTRSDAAAWFIREGIKAQQTLLDEVRGTVDEIRRLQERAQARARERDGEPPSL
ncbi:MAG: hypothetical protein M3442_15940, partial [Chloroflexota bacterium]|nr:hypothetical protein [Chloroflexota bacterium]